MEREEIRWFDLERRCGQWSPEDQREVLELAATRSTVDKDLAAAQGEIEDLEVDMAMLETSLSDKEDEIEELEELVAELKRELAAKAEGK